MIEFIGAAQIIADINNIVDDKKISESIGKACALIEKTAKEKTPVDTGELRRSITSEVKGLEGVVYTPLFYAPYIEFGTGLFAEEGGRKDVPWNYQDDEGEWHSTSGQKPHPFMRPALEQNREKVEAIIREGLEL